MLYHLNVKTTTFVNRNTDLFRRIQAQLIAADRKKLKILQVGPGMATKFVGRFNDYGRWRPVKRLETVLRRLPLPDACYENYETGELLSVFRAHEPELTVADIARKPLNVVARNFRDAPVMTVRLDLSDRRAGESAGLLGKFDLVVCMATVVRVPRKLQGTALENLVKFAAPGGLIVTDQDMTGCGMARIEGISHVFRKPAD